MLSADQAFCGFAVDDTAAARSFYADLLGIEVTGDDHGMLELHPAGNILSVVGQPTEG